MAKKQYYRKNNATVQKGKDNPKELVVQELSLVAPNRNRKDIGTLKAAIQRAESVQLPNRTQLYDTYHDVMSLDGHLSGVWRKRVDAVLNKNLKFVDKSSKKIDAFDALIYSNKFNRLIELIIESKAWGISGVEFIVGDKFDYEEINRKHIRPEQGLIVKSQYSSDGYDIDDLPFVWVVGDKNDLGQLLQCAMYALYKRGGLGDLAQYVEIFGQPVRIIYYDAYDTKTKGELRQLLNDSGSSLAMMIPKQAQFQMLDGKTSNGTGELQLGFIRYCDEAMSVATLGNSETTTSSKSSGYAQANIHSKQQLEITKSDIAFVQNVLNEPQFLEILRSYGYPVDGGSFEYEMEIDLETLKLRKEIDEFVAGKVPVGDDYWYDTYGIDKPENYDELKKQMQEREERQALMMQRAFTQPDDEDEPDKAPDKKPDPKDKEKEKDLSGRTEFTLKTKDKNLLQRLGAFFFGGVREINLADYYGTRCECCGGHKLHNLAANDAWDNIYEDIARKLLSEKLQKGDIHDGLYFETAKQLMDGLQDGLGGATFDYDDSRNVLKSYLTRNIYHFSAAKNLTELMAFRDMMVDPKTGDILSYSEFRKRIQDLGVQFNEAWLETEFNTAVSTAISAHKWESMDTEYLEFTTVGDDRVRPEHAILDGLTYPKNHPIWNKMTPPLSYNCRCGLKPGLARNYKAQDADNDEKYVGGLVKDTIFDNNPGVTRLVFDKQHPYFENMATGKLKELKYSNYGLQTLEEIHEKGSFKPLSLLNSHEDYNAYWNSMLNHDKGIVLENPIGEKVLLSDYDLNPKGNAKDFFKQHLLTRKGDADRFKLIANVEDIIQNPNEVWSVIKKSDSEPITNHYIKYYEGKTMLLVTVDNEARTMFELTATGYKTRSGLLLYKK